MKRTAFLPLLLALCLLLTGCSWLDGSYVSVKAHQEQHQESKVQSLTASSYRELMAVLSSLIAEGVETGVINVADYPADAIDTGMTVAIKYATETSPIGAYAVSAIHYELGYNNGLPALAVTISYRHSAAQIRAIQTVANVQQTRTLVARALENYDSEVVMLVESYTTEDFSQMVRSYAEEHPNAVMEVPQVTTSLHGIGRQKVVELSFTYQNSREDLRQMKTQAQPVFDAAVLYVSGDGEQRQKFAQLYTFLMERFPYQIETSITPAYSLLRHGVGDSRAFALVYAAMCREAGLTCLSVTGTCSGEPRTWNILSIDGQYYHLDLLACYEADGFQVLTDPQMTGYVWDYSAYPECPEVPAPAAPTQESSAPEQPAKDTSGEAAAPTETSTVPSEAIPDPTEDTKEEILE